MKIPTEIFIAIITALIGVVTAIYKWLISELKKVIEENTRLQRSQSLLLAQLSDAILNHNRVLIQLLSGGLSDDELISRLQSMLSNIEQKQEQIINSLTR